MRTINKSMVHINGQRKYQTSLAGNRFTGSHQRVTATIAGFGQCIGSGCEIHLRNSTQMHYIIISLLCQLLLGTIGIAIFGDIGYQLIRLGIKAFEIFVVRNPNRIKGLSGNSYRRNDIHFIMKNNLSVLVGTITEFRNFICRTHYGIQIIEKKGMARGSRCGTSFGTINLCGNGIPGIYKAPEEIVIVPALPCLDVYNVSHKVID